MVSSGKLDESNKCIRSRTMIDTLANRFGKSTRDELVATYEDNYWTARFDNCAEMK
ncbi:MAG: hypothetical protein ACLT2Z_09050 [Eubacterium sp.]